MQTEDHHRPSAAELADRIVRHGRNGLGQAEIAAEIGVGLAELARREARSARLTAALARAADAERAWWEAQPREALAAGARFNIGAWREAMRWRFGAAAGAAAGSAAANGAGARAAGAGAAAAKGGESDRPRAIYLIPDNGRQPGPDGKPLTPEQRFAREAAPVLERIERLERELADWREKLTEIEHWHDDDVEDEEDGDWDEDDWNDGDEDEDECDEDDGNRGEDERDQDGAGDDEAPKATVEAAAIDGEPANEDRREGAQLEHADAGPPVEPAPPYFGAKRVGDRYLW